MPETLHRNRGSEFENQIIYQLQQILGCHKTRTTPYRPQGNSVSARLHATLHSMLVMHVDIKQRNWVVFLPFLQLVYSSSYSSTVKETPFFLMFGRQARLPIDIILGIPHAREQVDTHEFSRQTQGSLQLAFEIARRNLIGNALMPNKQ